ncbi:MAG: hypothetical protein ABWZ79_14915 [Pedobacter agri]|uniref:Uncharacterized protein n=1 Tax=Pedobacter agri TaxID=454586 RepID=A0A9X3DEL2_9SPHI|nr:hypothetical protein [Pedobacter agri]MCX3266333.1 hypothetical protein [Pedobacter agri]MDQ1139174.1 cell division protein FtsW (lipid II flippase) [Pedobacter agri]
MLKIIGINLFLFVLYGFLIVVNTAVSERGFSIAIGMGLCIFIQVVLNIIAGIVFLIMGRQEWVKSFFISAAILAPVGFVTWLILLSIYG